MLTSLQAQSQAKAYSYNKTNFSIDQGKDGSLNYLATAFASYEAARTPEQRKAVLEQTVRTIDSTPTVDFGWEAIKGRLIPRVLGRTNLAAFCHQSGQAYPFESLSPTGDLVTTIAVDHPNQVVYPSLESWNSWGKSFEDVLKQAKANLGKLHHAFAELRPGLYVSDFQDINAPGRLLHPSGFKKLAVQGEPVVLAINREVVMVTGSLDSDGIECVFQNGVKRLDSVAPCWAEPLVLDGNGTWKTFPYDSQASRFYRTATQQLRYEQQRALLEQQLSRGEIRGVRNPVYVSQTRAVQDKVGEPFSFTTCPFGSCCWLSQADQVWFIQEKADGEHLSVELSWSSARDLVAFRELSGDEFWPTRWEVEVQWTPELWARMKEHQVTS